MLNDFAKPKALSKSSEYDISVCIHHYALCINEWYELSKKASIGAEWLQKCVVAPGRRVQNVKNVSSPPGDALPKDMK